MRAALFALLLVGCGGGDPGTSSDMAQGRDLAVFSVCGHPGDVGNSIGVGKYCTHITGDCNPPAGVDMSVAKWATLCSVLGSDNAFFCTKTCTPPANDMTPSTECGENAYCQCGSGSAQSGCGCYPTSCQ